MRCILNTLCNDLLCMNGDRLGVTAHVHRVSALSMASQTAARGHRNVREAHTNSRLAISINLSKSLAFCERPVWTAPHLLQVISTKKCQVGKKFKQDPRPYRKCPLLNARFKILRIP